MKLKTINNAEIVIQANLNKAGDFEKAMKLAELISSNNPGCIDIASSCETEQWVHLCAVWDNRQAHELKDEYTIAKKALAKAA